MHEGLLASCKRRGDLTCSMPCESKNPATQFIRHGKRHRIFGCPGDHLCGSVRKFHADYDLQQKGIMAPYSHAELPGKYAELIPMYEDWRVFWASRREEMASGNVPIMQKQIDAYRRAHPRP